MTGRWNRHALTGPSVLLIVGRTAGAVVAFILPVVLARIFTPDEFGTYKQLFLIFGTMYGLAQLGMAESLYYFLPARADRAGALTSNTVLTLSLAGVTAAAAIGGLAASLGGWLGNPSLAQTLGHLGVFLALMLASAAFEIVLVARGHFARAAWTYALSDVGRAIAMLSAVGFLGGVRGLMWGAIAFAALRLVAMGRVVAREFGPRLHVDAALWRRQLAYALPFAAAVSLELVHLGYPQYFVAAHVDAATFAIFAVGCLQVPLVDVIATSMANVLMVRMGDRARSGRSDTARLWHDTMAKLALIIAPIAVLLIVVAEDLIVALFTATYAASVPVFSLWALTILPSVFCVDAVLRARARTRALLWLNLVRLALVATFVGAGLTAFGLPGVVMVVVASAAITRAIGVVAIARELSLSPARALPWARLARVTACAVAAGAPAVLVRDAVAFGPWGRLAAAAVTYGAAYGLGCLAFAVVPRLVRANTWSRRPLRAWLSEG
jgi:O-antigen/teichoic acid export membrane protein